MCSRRLIQRILQFLGVLLILLVDSQLTRAQLMVSGKVYFADDSSEVYNAHVYVKGTSYGTTTNKEGEFRLYILPHIAADTIVISYLGYSSVVFFPSNNLRKQIYLKGDQSLLEEVMVSPDSGQWIIDQVILNLPSNYPKGFDNYEIYYREVIKNNRQFNRYLEIAAELTTLGFSNEKVSSKDFKSIQINGKKAFQTPDDQSINEDRIYSNGIIAALTINWLRLDLSHEYADSHVFELVGSSQFQDKPLYHVTMYSSKVFKNHGIKVYTHYYITMDTFALVAVRYKEDWGENHFPIDQKEGPPNNQVELNIDFQEREGKWYVSYIQDYRRKVFEDGSSQSADRTLRVLDVQKRRNLRNGVKMNYHTDIFNYPIANNTGFWTTYNAPPVTELEKRIKRELEQYNANSSPGISNQENYEIE